VVDGWMAAPPRARVRGRRRRRRALAEPPPSCVAIHRAKSLRSSALTFVTAGRYGQCFRDTSEVHVTVVSLLLKLLC